jgi:hypothetical protein
MELNTGHAGLSVRYLRYSPLLFIALGIFYISSFSGNWKPEWDSAYYLIIARSILDGNGFSYLGYPCLKIPFGFPVLIAPVLWLSRSGYLIMNGFMLLFTGLALLMIYLCLRRLFQAYYAALLTFCTGWCSLMLTYSGYIMIDIPYVAFSFGALVFIHAYIRRATMLNGLAAVTFILAAFFLRTVGIALIGATALFFLLYHRPLLIRYRFVFLAALIVLPVVLWMLHTRSVKIEADDPVWQLQEFVRSKDEARRFRFDDPTSAITGPGDVLKRGAMNLVYYAGVSSSLLSGVKVNPKKENLRLLPIPTLGLLAVFASGILAGMIASITGRRTILDFYFVLYMGILLSWSAREPRYLLPVLPVLIHYFIKGGTILFQGIEKCVPVVQRHSSSLVRWSVPIFLVAYIALQARENVSILQQQNSTEFYSPAMQDFFAAAGWIKGNVPDSARVVSVLAPVASLYTERQCFSFPRVEDHEWILHFLDKVRGRYLLVNPSYGREERYLASLVEANPENFHQLFTRGNAVVYRIDRDRLSNARMVEPGIKTINME